MGQQVSGSPSGPEALKRAFGTRLEHKNNDAGVNTTGETVTFAKAGGWLLVSNKDGTDDLLISFDAGITFFTITAARRYQEFFGDFPSVFVKASAGLVPYEIVG